MSESCGSCPANEASWDDLQSILTGAAARCQCQRQRLGDHDWFRMPQTERSAILRSEVHCDDPRATETIGIVAYLGDEPVGWCAVDRAVGLRPAARLAGAVDGTIRRQG